MTHGFTHKALCIVACQWLSRTRRCAHTFADVGSMHLNEFPDAIGFRPRAYGGGSTVIEVKVSVEDFKRDSAKGWRQRERLGLGGGMGRWRYYLVPEGLIGEADVPLDHGLLWVTDKSRVRMIRAAPERAARDFESEVTLLCAMLRRRDLGAVWIPSEFRFETMDEAKNRDTREAPR